MGILIKHGDDTFDASAVIRYRQYDWRSKSIEDKSEEFTTQNAILEIVFPTTRIEIVFESLEEMKAMTDRIDSCHVLFAEMEADRKRMMINLGMSVE